jgi:hypothetical protein
MCLWNCSTDVVQHFQNTPSVTQRAMRCKRPAAKQAASAPARIVAPDISAEIRASVLIRYEATAERTFHAARNQLVKVRKEREKSEIGFESQESAAKP